VSQESQVFELVSRLATADDDKRVRREATDTLARSFAERPETFDILWDRAVVDDSEDVRTAAVRAMVYSFAERPETLEILRRSAQADVSAGVRAMATLGWAQTLDSLPLRRLLTRDLDGVAPGIDPHAAIDLDRVAAAASRLRQDANAVREHYERLVREYGFPLRLCWVEDGGRRSAFAY
jgi:HEAT repeat protein